jgi:hypothetical protein
LGYNNLFQPIKPRLTDALLALIAARDSLTETLQTIRYVEGPDVNPDLVNLNFCETMPSPRKERCRSLWKDMDLNRAGENGSTCESQDMRLVLWSAFHPSPNTRPPYSAPRVYLRCFERAARKYLSSSGSDAVSPSAIGLARGAVADFLFNYKVSQQYPHEFDYYELGHSADALNAALNPLIEAFNRDLTSFQRFVRGEVELRVEQINRDYDDRCCVKRLFSLDKPSFFNDGIITVRTVSGQWTYASSTSQSFLNASSAPKLTDLMNSLTASTPAAGTPPTAPISSLLPNLAGLKSAQLAASFLNNYQTTYAQIGRTLAISAIPRSLATASAAEIVVSLNMDDQAGTGLYSGGPQNGQPANISRVSNNDTSTRVRVESVKLFELSSAGAVLQRSHERFPLLPPFVELPYIGTIAGIPLAPAKEYHQSTAILSAVVVPTAADIAYGLQFEWDEMVDSEKKTCSLLRTASAGDRCDHHRILSLRDFGPSRSIQDYNDTMVHCLSTDMRSGYSSIGGNTTEAASYCQGLKLGAESAAAK